MGGTGISGGIGIPDGGMGDGGAGFAAGGAGFTTGGGCVGRVAGFRAGAAQPDRQ
ncbi:MAG: hypothetical protein Q8M86_04755 [Syntrophales bacterium]|nr:hypothetical protein [Syntrophales bacterium]